ncbi:M67 family metallopeptidase [Paenibacillus sp. LHD-117]|uniref:M67 family metallopeptidase n=1 Tax=Paenibacillus sp. LHD-117 TaxID=3071412 RepID=UPI0027E0AA85|nr:M67 family metallopeptidase [Paenibacillus sp. LHD-117]MDQ6423301.1 M67 family metallopeptidase [Paenibacillus sp. LHD-117]
MGSHFESTGRITKETYDRLIRTCEQALPDEACGVLAQGPESEAIDIVIPIRNVHPSPSVSFSFDPEEWTAAYFNMQKNRQSLVGFFHSHPHTAATPSYRDSRGFLHESGLTYWIVSLTPGASPDVKPYRPVQGSFVPIPLVLA